MFAVHEAAHDPGCKNAVATDIGPELNVGFRCAAEVAGAKLRKRVSAG